MGTTASCPSTTAPLPARRSGELMKMRPRRSPPTRLLPLDPSTSTGTSMSMVSLSGRRADVYRLEVRFTSTSTSPPPCTPPPSPIMAADVKHHNQLHGRFTIGALRDPPFFIVPHTTEFVALDPGPRLKLTLWFPGPEIYHEPSLYAQWSQQSRINPLVLQRQHQSPRNGARYCILQYLSLQFTKRDTNCFHRGEDFTPHSHEGPIFKYLTPVGDNSEGSVWVEVSHPLNSAVAPRSS